MDTQILEDIGLTKGEINVYLSLLEIQNSVFHFNINRLIEKGLASYIKKGKTRVYQAADPDNFIIYLRDKEDKIKKALPELKAKQSLSKEKEAAELFEGIKGITTLLNALIADAKKGDEFFFFSVDMGEKSETILKFYERYDTKRKAKGLITKGIANKRLEKFLKHRTYLKMKYVDFPTPPNMAVCNNKMAIFSWGEKPRGVLIQSELIVNKEKEFFKSLWASIK